MTCHNLLITYVYVRSAYLISRQLSQKGELSDFKLVTPGVFLELCFVVLSFYICSCAILFFPLMQLTPDEEQRRKLRRERNKVAASKCRMKRKEHVNTLRKVGATFARSLNRFRLMQTLRGSRNLCCPDNVISELCFSCNLRK